MGSSEETTIARPDEREVRRDKTGTPDPVRLGLARYVAWVLLALILCFAVFLAIVFGNRARETVLTKQKNFAGILAEHLNQQIFLRFSIPVVAGYSRVDLKQNAQYVMLDKTIEDLTHGLQVHDLRIYDLDGVVKYSSRNRDDVGFFSAETERNAKEADEKRSPIFILERNISLWESFFVFFHKKSGAFFLRTTAPMRPVYSLRVENTATYGVQTGPSLGVLEFSQDITKDMGDIARLQWTIVVVTLMSSLLIFFLLSFFLHRAEDALALRVKEQQRLHRELHQNEKLVSMGRVVAGIAHEIRNPLGIIQSSAELLLSRKAAEDPLTGKILRAIFDESRRLSQTVRDFLDYARPRQPEQNTVDLAQTIGDVLAFLEPEIAARQVTAKTDFTPQWTGADGIYTLGDKDLLYRAFYNIMSNSLQAMEGGGTIRITVKPDSAKKSGKSRADRVEIRFMDTGPGFPARDRERLLDPFVTTKDGGTGLGLPIVNNIITSHGGTMRLEDAPGGGAMVLLVLPGIPAP
ncbi:two-component sensor histidine kinase [Deltaproteobacteria bacterium]|nr:two-component sensor histidine kinase [Deltaproteobacteria bacterium]